MKTELFRFSPIATGISRRKEAIYIYRKNTMSDNNYPKENNIFSEVFKSFNDVFEMYGYLRYKSFYQPLTKAQKTLYNFLENEIIEKASNEQEGAIKGEFNPNSDEVQIIKIYLKDPKDHIIYRIMRDKYNIFEDRIEILSRIKCPTEIDDIYNKKIKILPKKN